MALLEKLSRKLRGARRLETFLLIGLTAIALLCLLKMDRGAGAGTELEARMERALSQVEGAGRVRVMVTQSEDGAAEGVLVVCEGADRLSVRLCVQNAVQTLLNIDASRVEIVEMQRKDGQ